MMPEWLGAAEQACDVAVEGRSELRAPERVGWSEEHAAVSSSSSGGWRGTARDGQRVRGLGKKAQKEHMLTCNMTG